MKVKSNVKAGGLGWAAQPDGRAVRAARRGRPGITYSEAVARIAAGKADGGDHLPRRLRRAAESIITAGGDGRLEWMRAVKKNLRAGRRIGKEIKQMKHRNSDSGVQKKTSARILAIAITPVIFALTIAACSTATNPAATTPPEPSKARANSSSPDSAPTTSNSAGDDLAGTYRVNGAGADGKTYQGEVVVTKRDAVYQMSWKLGAEDYDGVAVQSGNTLAATFTTGTDGRGCGAIIYQRNADKSLDGKWGEWGVNSVGAEKGVPAGEPSGGVATFNLTGTNADGSPYKGRLTISEGGNNVYQLAWDTGTKFIGTGVRVGERLAAGWGARQCGFVIYEVKGDTLEGKWGVPGSTALGTEKATKK